MSSLLSLLCNNILLLHTAGQGKSSDACLVIIPLALRSLPSFVGGGNASVDLFINLLFCRNLRAMEE
jgi:hypothetical protein